MDAAPNYHTPFGLPTDFKPIAVKSIYFDSQSALSGVSSYSPQGSVLTQPQFEYSAMKISEIFAKNKQQNTQPTAYQAYTTAKEIDRLRRLRVVPKNLLKMQKHAMDAGRFKNQIISGGSSPDRSFQEDLPSARPQQFSVSITKNSHGHQRASSQMEVDHYPLKSPRKDSKLIHLQSKLNQEQLQSVAKRIDLYRKNRVLKKTQYFPNFAGNQLGENNWQGQSQVAK